MFGRQDQKQDFQKIITKPSMIFPVSNLIKYLVHGEIGADS